MRNAIDAFRNENFVSSNRIHEAVKYGQAISGLKGKIIRLPFKALTAMDEFFSTLGHSASLYSQATRQVLKEGGKGFPLRRITELVKKDTAEMMVQAAKDGLKDTYRQPLGASMRALQKAQQTNVGRFIIPFFRTPVNLFKWSVHRSPLGLVTNWPQILKGTAEQRAEAIGRMALGQVISAGMAMEAWQGNITGRLSGDKAKREALLRQGIQPYSIKLGNKYYSYRSFEPISSWLALVANTVEIMQERGETPSDKIVTIVAETLKMMKDQSFVRGISTLSRALDDPEKMGPRFLKESLFSTVPFSSGLRYAARMADPILREPDTIPEYMKANLPYFSKKVPPKLDVWGRPITKEGNLAQRALVPSGAMTEKPDVTEQELMSLEVFPKKVAKKYRGIKLTNYERNLITRAEGRIVKPVIDRLVKTAEYKSMQPWEQEETISRIFSDVRKAIRIPFTNKKRIQMIREAKTEEERLRLIEEFTNKTLFKR